MSCTAFFFLIIPTLTAFTADEDQQLLLATEAVIIEGTVELDWNLVGEKMPQQVTGEAIKQHLYKVREARESAGMVTPAKAEGKSAFGTRRGVVRYPPTPDPNATPIDKKRLRAEPKTSRGKGKKARGEEDDDEEFIESKSKAPSKIKHRSLLFAPAVPKKENSSSPAQAGSNLIIKLSNKRKIKEESHEGKAETATVATPSKPQAKRLKKAKASPPEVALSGEPQRPVVIKGRKSMPSNFDPETVKKQMEQMKRESEGNSVLAPPKKQEVLAAQVAMPEVLAPKAANADVRNYFKPTVKKETASKPKKPVAAVDTPVFTERSLRTKPTRPNYREGNAVLSDDEQSEQSGVEINAEDDEYEPETFEDDGVLNATKTKKKIVKGNVKVFAEDQVIPPQSEEAVEPVPKQQNVQSDDMDILQPAMIDQDRQPGEDFFSQSFFTGDFNVSMTNTGQRLGFDLGGSNRRATAADSPSLFDNFQNDLFAPGAFDGTMANSFGVGGDLSLPNFNNGFLNVGGQFNSGQMLDGGRIGEDQMEEGGQNPGVYGPPQFNDFWGDDNLMQ